jgi:hypothetical protein
MPRVTTPRFRFWIPSLPHPFDVLDEGAMSL